MKNQGVLLCSGCTDNEVLFTYINEFTGSRSKLDNFVRLENLSSEVITSYTKVIIALSLSYWIF